MAIQRVSNVEFDRWNDFRRAVNQMIDNGSYERLVSIHTEMTRDPDGFQYGLHRMHGTFVGPIGFRRFLPWHRAYLIMFERELRSVDSSLSIPYWDWNTDRGQLIGFRTFMGLSSRRALGTLPGDPELPGREPWFSSEPEFQSLVDYGGDYYTFASYLETNPHNGGHRWIGGDMNSMASPRDPGILVTPCSSGSHMDFMAAE